MELLWKIWSICCISSFCSFNFWGHSPDFVACPLIKNWTSNCPQISCYVTDHSQICKKTQNTVNLKKKRFLEILLHVGIWPSCLKQHHQTLRSQNLTGPSKCSVNNTPDVNINLSLEIHVKKYGHISLYIAYTDKMRQATNHAIFLFFVCLLSLLPSLLNSVGVENYSSRANSQVYLQSRVAE